MKECFRCNKKLPETEFYRHKNMNDGYLGKCKACTRDDVLKNRLKNIDRIREYDRNRGYRGSYSWELKHPIARKAHWTVNNATRKGRLLKQPCSVCGAKKSVAHHDNYLKPLDVIWFCQIHHKAHHKVLKEKGVNLYG